jgi:signal transduction histidine kinase
MLAALGPAAIVLVTAWFVYGVLDASIHASHDAARSADTLAGINLLSRVAVDQESGERGYVISGDQAFLLPYEEGKARFDDVIVEMGRLVVDDPTQQARLLEIGALHARWQREVAERAIAAVDAGQQQVAVDIARSGAGKAIFDDIRRVTAAMETQAGAELEARRAVRDEASMVAQRAIVIGPLLAAILSVVFGLVVAHQIVRGVRRVGAAATGVTSGDLSRRAAVGSNDEVGVLADAFNTMAERIETLVAVEQQTSSRLRDQAAQLEEANGELETFSYSVSHDLRAPLRTIDGFGQILLQDHAEQLDEEGRRLLGRTRAASQRMGAIIDDLLELSRVNRAVIERQAVDLGSVARGVVDRLRRADPERDDVTVVIGDDLTTKADPGLARIVMENLLGNAWKFTARTTSATIRLERAGPDTFRIADDGAGFDMTYATKLFQPFQRLHRGEDFPGSGIGLATVQRILRRHGGSARAIGGLGTGATFWFSFGHPLTPEETR